MKGPAIIAGYLASSCSLEVSTAYNRLLGLQSMYWMCINDCIRNAAWRKQYKCEKPIILLFC